jgi:hypothetical protein
MNDFEEVGNPSEHDLDRSRRIGTDVSGYGSRLRLSDLPVRHCGQALN